MRLALAGLGSAAQRGHLPAIRHLAARGDVELLGVCDSNPDQLSATQRFLPDVPGFLDATTMLDSLRPDLIVIAADPAAHTPLIALSLDRRCDVLCEKPVLVTETDHRTLEHLRIQRPECALVAVHQYRHAPGWRHLTEWAHGSLTAPFRLAVRVERPGTDPYALSSWRTDSNAGGGLADHGVHYLALARELQTTMSASSATRTYDHRGHERVRGRIVVGPGALDIEVKYGADARRTTVTIEADDSWLNWRNDEMQWGTGRHSAHRRTVPSLSSREHVDALYLHLYRELLANRHGAAWRRDRWNEALDIGRVLIDLNRAAAIPLAAGAGHPI